MKLFTKAVATSAAAVAISFAGAGIASAQDAPTTTPVASETTTPVATDTTTPAANDTTTPVKETATVTVTPTEDASSKPSTIKDWIAVFTAIIGALGTVLAFASKYFKLPF